MYRGTTPTITINCDIDVSEFVTMWVTFRTQQLATYAPPKQVEVTKHLGDEGVDATEKVVTVSLTQADTLLLGSLSPDEDQQVEVQIRGRTEDGRAFASNITLPKSNTRRRTSSPVRGSTRSSTKEVSSMAAKKRRRKRKKKIEVSKKLAYWAASVATLSAASSLLLSAFGRDPVGELTGTIFTACVGYLITYAGKSLGEKISRNRHGLDADGNPLPDPSGDTLNNEEAKG